MQKPALLLTASLLIPASSWATIDVNSQLSLQGDNIKLTIPGSNPGGNVRFYIDMDNNPETGSTNQESALAGADYYIENDIIYSAAGDTWEYVSGDLISFSNDKENLELNINTTTFDTLASSSGLLNNDNRISGFDGTVQMNVVTLDDQWNIVDSTGPTEYNILDIEVPVATEEQPDDTVVTEVPPAETEPESETETDASTTDASTDVAATETRQERRRRLRQERRQARAERRQARREARELRRQERRNRRQEQTAAN